MLARWLSSRLARFRKSVLLLGPRQVGKSTLCRSLKPDVEISLVDEETFLAYAKDPGRLKREILALTQPSLVLIDEIQRVPALLNTVQMLVDRPGDGPKHRFLLTGSSARKLRRGGANLLPGRVILEYLDPLHCLEAGSLFSLDHALQVGMLPGVLAEFVEGSPDEKTEAIRTLGTYVDVYLREEIRAEAFTRDIGGYARFLDVIAASSGQWLNYSKVSSDAEVPKETVRRYVSLLEDTLIAFRISPFAPKGAVARRISQRDRVLIFDVGVSNALLGNHRAPVSLERRGPVFEQWFMLQVLYSKHALGTDWRISSYRTESGAEVDLVVEREDDFIGLEIKASRNVGRSDTRGLQSLAEVVGRRKPLLRRIAYLGDKPQAFEDGTLALPFREALQELCEASR